MSANMVTMCFLISLYLFGILITLSSKEMRVTSEKYKHEKMYVFVKIMCTLLWPAIVVIAFAYGRKK